MSRQPRRPFYVVEDQAGRRCGHSHRTPGAAANCLRHQPTGASPQHRLTGDLRVIEVGKRAVRALPIGGAA